MLSFAQTLREGISERLPEYPEFSDRISRAPRRALNLNARERQLALANALRYFPSPWHETLAPEFAAELKAYGRIYMHRFRPTYAMYARPIQDTMLARFRVLPSCT